MDDNEEEEEEEEEESDSSSEYGPGNKRKDGDYNVSSDAEYDSDCLNYDEVKRQIMKQPGAVDITTRRWSLDKNKQ